MNNKTASKASSTATKDSKKITVDINGKKYSGTKGNTVMEIALANGIQIPHLCYDPRQKPRAPAAFAW